MTGMPWHVLKVFSNQTRKQSVLSLSLSLKKAISVYSLSIFSNSSLQAGRVPMQDSKWGATLVQES